MKESDNYLVMPGSKWQHSQGKIVEVMYVFPVVGSSGRKDSTPVVAWKDSSGFACQISLGHFKQLFRPYKNGLQIACERV